MKSKKIHSQEDHAPELKMNLLAEEVLSFEGNGQYHHIFENSQIGIYRTTPDGRILVCNPALLRMIGYSTFDELANRNLDNDWFVPDFPRSRFKAMMEAKGEVKGLETAWKRRDNSTLYVRENARAVRGKNGEILFYDGTIEDITETRKAAEALAARARELAVLYETSLAINAQLDLPTLLRTIIERAVELVGTSMGAVYLMEPDNESLKLVVAYNLPENYLGVILKLGEGLSGQVAQTGKVQMVADYLQWNGKAPVFSNSPFRRTLGVPMKLKEKVIGVITVTDDQKTDLFDEAKVQLVSLFADQAARAVDNARLYEALQRELAERKRADLVQMATYRISELAQTAQSLPELFASIHKIIGELTPAQDFYIALYDPATDLLSFPYFADAFENEAEAIHPEKSLTGYVLRTGKPLLATPQVFKQLVVSGQVELVGAPSVDWLGVPLRTPSGETIGVIAVQSYDSSVRLGERDESILVFVSNQIAMVIEQQKSQDALRESEQKYRSIFEYAPVGIFQSTLQGKLSYVNPEFSRIFGYNSPEELINFVNQTDVAKALYVDPSRRPTFVTTVTESGDWKRFENLYYRKDGSIMNATLTFRSSKEPGNGKIFLTGFVEDITERKRAEFKEREYLQHELVLHAELTEAYDTTLEGWSRALDLRDRETEGHAKRVTEMTVLLARTLGVNEAELVHLRRGALLHDIGKMGVPDEILRKQGPLNEEEWVIMRKHPVYAYELLKPVAFLRPALDIPYYHHECWDGSGYPHGLKGEKIPKAARIFTLLDVWDALRSNRPYSLAWSEQAALDYIRSQRGVRFDPEVVDAFMTIFEKIRLIK